MSDFSHISVMPNECLEHLNISSAKVYFDGTLGGAGHSSLILEAGAGKLYSFDQDTAVIDRHTAKAQKHSNWNLVHANFAQIPEYCKENNIQIDGGILLDLGLSSIQLDDPERGFSFKYDTALDMRMNQTQDLTAQDVINRFKEQELADIFFHYGEERRSRQIAKLVVQNRPFKSSLELADLVKNFYVKGAKGKSFKIHPATKVFQALRIYVNSELDVLEKVLIEAPEIMQSGARFAVISFHSLEDRIVKYKFRELAKEGKAQILTKKPLEAQAQEIELNPRSRSAKLRVIEII